MCPKFHSICFEKRISIGKRFRPSKAVSINQFFSLEKRATIRKHSNLSRGIIISQSLWLERRASISK